MDASLTEDATREAIILAGGLGTRLRSVMPNMPKVLAPVAGRPFLAHILGFLEQNDFSRVVLAVGYRHEDVMATFGKRFGKIEIDYSIEDHPLGTGGAVWLASCRVTPERNFFVFNGDTYTAVDFSAMENSMAAKSADLAIATRAMPDTGRYGLVQIDDNGLLTGFREKTPGHAGIINAGVYLMRHDLPQRFSFPEAFSLENDLLSLRCKDLRIAAVPMDGYFIDIGIPEDYEKANRDLR